MVSVDNTPRTKQHGAFEFSFKGLSTDDKPTNTYKDMKIANGSTFFEMDTKTVKFYDEENNAWV